MHRCRFFCLIIKEYISMNNTSNKALTLSWRRSLSYRNQPIDLLCNLMEWFLHEKDLHQERVKTLFTHHTPKVCFYILYSRISFLFFFFFFFNFFSIYLGFLSRISWFAGQQSKEKAILLYTLYHFRWLHRYSDISQVSAAESSPLRIAGSRTPTDNLWFPSTSR